MHDPLSLCYVAYVESYKVIVGGECLGSICCHEAGSAGPFRVTVHPYLSRPDGSPDAEAIWNALGFHPTMEEALKSFKEIMKLQPRQIVTLKPKIPIP